MKALKKFPTDIFFNTTGLHADEVAQKFNIGKELTILPLKEYIGN